MFCNQNELSSPIAAKFCATIFGLDFRFYVIFYLFEKVNQIMMSKKVRILIFQFIQPHKEHH